MAAGADWYDTDEMDAAAGAQSQLLPPNADRQN